MTKFEAAGDRIREFVLAKYPLARKRGVQDGDALLESGIIDSMGVLELVEFVEQEFSISVSDDELVPDNFQTIQRLADFVNKKQGGSFSQAGAGDSARSAGAPERLR